MGSWATVGFSGPCRTLRTLRPLWPLGPLGPSGILGPPWPCRALWDPGPLWAFQASKALGPLTGATGGLQDGEAFSHVYQACSQIAARRHKMAHWTCEIACVHKLRMRVRGASAKLQCRSDVHEHGDDTVSGRISSQVDRPISQGMHVRSRMSKNCAS